MLAKRFAIVCFMTMLFGMGFSSLVAQDTNWRGGYSSASSTGCSTGFGSDCSFSRF